MKAIHSIAVSALLCLLLLSVGACSDSGKSAASAEALTSDAGLLQFIPADSPYVLVAAEALPDRTREALQKKSAKTVQAYAKMLKIALREAGEEADVEDRERRDGVAAILADLTQLMTPEGLEAAGVDRRTTLAVYGHELWPVLRVSLSDAAAMEATLSRFERQAGEKMPTASVDGHTYRYADGDDELRLVVAVLENYLVASLLPAGHSDELLESVLGLELPETSMAESGGLADLAEEYGYTAYGLGFLDVERVAGVLLDEQSGINQGLLADAGVGDISDVCRAEVRSIAGIAPRIVTGYTEITEKRIVSHSVVELRSDIAEGLATLTAPVPGLGQKRQSGLITFGMSLNPQAARDFYSARLDALEAEPWQCEWFAELQDSAARGREMLNQPWPPVVYSFRGFLASIDDLSGMDLQAGQPPTDIDMQLLVATDNAEALVAMGAMFSPDIAALNLKADARPVSLPLPAIASQFQAAHIAMSDRALAVSVGAGNEAQLPDMLAAPVADPPPFMSSDIDADAYYGLVGSTAMRSDGDRSPEFEQAFRETMRSLQGLFSRLSLDVYFTGRGIEIPSTAELKD